MVNIAGVLELTHQMLLLDTPICDEGSQIQYSTW